MDRDSTFLSEEELLALGGAQQVPQSAVTEGSGGWHSYNNQLPAHSQSAGLAYSHSKLAHWRDCRLFTFATVHRLQSRVPVARDPDLYSCAASIFADAAEVNFHVVNEAILSRQSRHSLQSSDHTWQCYLSYSECFTLIVHQSVFHGKFLCTLRSRGTMHAFACFLTLSSKCLSEHEVQPLKCHAMLHSNWHSFQKSVRIECNCAVQGLMKAGLRLVSKIG